MTSQNLFELAKSGQLGTDKLDFPGYCLAAAIDATFDRVDVPVEVYRANQAAVASGEMGSEASATDTFYNLLGQLVFDDPDPATFDARSCSFSTIDELRDDLGGLRNKSTILLDVEGGKHVVGLKPVGENSETWQSTGLHQIVAAQTVGQPVEVQCLLEPETITTEQVWSLLRANNPAETDVYTGLVFPPEPR